VIRFFIAKLKASIQNLDLPNTYDQFQFITRWQAGLKRRLGLTTDKESGRLVRALPKSLTGNDGAGRELSQLIGLPEEICVQALQAFCWRDILLPTGDEFSGFCFPVTPIYQPRWHSLCLSGSGRGSPYHRIWTKFVPGDRDKLLPHLLFAVSAARSITLFDVLRIMKADPSSFLPRELNGKQRFWWWWARIPLSKPG
jgi:hypothetical protein